MNASCQKQFNIIPPCKRCVIPQTIFFGGDDAPQLQQMKIRYKTRYDFDAEKAMELRQKWWQQGNEERWTFLFYHDIKNAVYQKAK